MTRISGILARASRPYHALARYKNFPSAALRDSLFASDKNV